MLLSWNKIRISYNFIKLVLNELIIDLYFYYTSLYPLHRILGAFRRIKRRLKFLWLPKGKGRPPINENLVSLILEMKRANLLWGAKRIRDELMLLGISIHKKTISRILKDNGFSTPPINYHPPTWRALVASCSSTWSMDFCNIIDISCFQIYVLTIIDYHTREIIHMNVTLNPNRDWLVQQFKNIAINEYIFPELIIIDNDAIYGKWIDPMLKEYFDINVLRTRPKCPWENGRIERYFRTLRVELLNRIPIMNENQIAMFCSSYKSYYNKIRPHQGLSGNIPSSTNKKNSKNCNISNLKIIKKTHVHGLFTEFKLVS